MNRAREFLVRNTPHPVRSSGIDGHHELITSTARPLSLFREGKGITKRVS